jgi:hypothetical protein
VGNASAKRLAIASERFNFVNSFFFYQMGGHFAAPGLTLPDQHISKFALEIGKW